MPFTPFTPFTPVTPVTPVTFFSSLLLSFFLLTKIWTGTAKAGEKAKQIAGVKQPYLDRMHDLSCFVGELKQRLSQWPRWRPTSI